VLIETDEGVRAETTVESLGQLRGAFEKDGTITAGNASQISDGGAAVLVMSAERAEQLGLAPLGELVSYGQVAGPDASLLTQPSRAIAQAAKKAKLDLSSIDLFEITRRSPPWGSPPPMTSVSMKTRSTSMAAPSPSVIRLGCRERALRSPHSLSYVDAAVVWPRWPSAVVAVKVTPPFFAPSNRGRSSPRVVMLQSDRPILRQFEDEGTAQWIVIVAQLVGQLLGQREHQLEHVGLWGRQQRRR